MQEGGGENLALMEKDSLPRRRPGRTRISYHKKVTRVATKGGEDSGLSKEPRPPISVMDSIVAQLGSI